MSTAVGIQAVSGLNFSYSWAGSPKTGTSEWLITDGALLARLPAREPAATSGGLNCVQMASSSSCRISAANSSK